MNGRKFLMVSAGVIAAVGGCAMVRNWSNIIEMSISGEQRVATAKRNYDKVIDARLAELGVSKAQLRLFVRAFKSEHILELWVGDGSAPMKLYRSYPIAGMSGTLGPKRKEGDKQVPEGIYRVDRFNPESRFHLSLGINYPNESDRIRSDPKKPGGDIFIHGDNRSIGCLAMTDEKIEEIYVLALRARGRGIPVHIFPFRMSESTFARMKKANPDQTLLWDELEAIYLAFEATKQVPSTKVLKDGTYALIRK